MSGLAVKDYLREGNYSSWTYKWANQLPCTAYSERHTAFWIDDKNGYIYVAWRCATDSKSHFGVFSISDFSSVFASPNGSHYQTMYPDVIRSTYLAQNQGDFQLGAMSVSMLSYLLLLRDDDLTVEIWQKGAKKWSRDVSSDMGTVSYVFNGIISLTGRYVLFYVSAGASGHFLMLYEA